VTLFASPLDRGLVEGELPDGFDVAFAASEAPSSGPVVRFAEKRMAAAELLVGSGRDDLWRWAPWPVSDDLFMLPPPRDDAPVLIVHKTEAWRERIVSAFADAGVDAHGAGRLDRRELEACGVVLFLDHEGFPPTAFSVCAAGRLLVMADVAPLFGLQHGIDCLIAAGEAHPLALAQAARHAPRAFDGIRRMGRLAAAAHRASDVYERLALDLSLGVGMSEASRRRA
jgi:hypothetical protein